MELRIKTLLYHLMELLLLLILIGQVEDTYL